jgi:hypothetical protein
MIRIIMMHSCTSDNDHIYIYIINISMKYGLDDVIGN